MNSKEGASITSHEPKDQNYISNIPQSTQFRAQISTERQENYRRDQIRKIIMLGLGF